jgi:hypothetical protein
MTKKFAFIKEGPVKIACKLNVFSPVLYEKFFLADL